MVNKKELIEKLYELWELHPELRFVQLIDWITEGDTYYMSNASVNNRIEFLIKNFKNK